MGFLKRFFSIGSRKSKKSSKRGHQQLEQIAEVDQTGRLQPEQWQQVEGDATRLLRSSSAHYAVVSETDYTLLPPLPHPINSVVHTPKTSPARSTLTTLTTLTPNGPSVQRSKSFTVTVHERKLESKTVFPNANPPITQDSPTKPRTPARSRNISSTSTDYADSPLRLNHRSDPVTPRDQSRLIRLRQDPSVASLLNMYDEKGRICSNAFSNTPPTPTPIRDEVVQFQEGRVQRKRTGSTLRQLLLGNDDSNRESGIFEGDISWAERYLGEHEGADTSLADTPLQTPQDILFADGPSKAQVTFLSEGSQDVSTNFPFISSMEVEVSAEVARLEPSMDVSSPVVPGTTIATPTPPPPPAEQKTPQRASEVFGFLTERRKSVLARQKNQRQLEKVDVDRPLPALPLSTFNESLRCDTNVGLTPACDTSVDTAEIHTATVTKLTHVLNPLSRSQEDLLRQYTSHASDTKHDGRSSQSRTSSARIQQTTTGSSMTSNSTSNSTSSGPSKIPRGPRPASAAAPASSHIPVHSPSPAPSAEVTRLKAQEPITPSRPAGSRIPIHHDNVHHEPLAPVHPRQQRRITSTSSSVFSAEDCEDSKVSIQKRTRKYERATERGKENSPVTNLPPRTIFEQRYPNHMRSDPPSPASSSDLSPIGKDMMMNLRKQRMRAREEIRYGSGGRSRRRLS